MDSSSNARMVTHNPGHVLTEVGKFMKQERPDMTVTVPFHTTWKACLELILAELDGDDGFVSIFPPMSAARRQEIREQALQNVKNNAMQSGR